MKLTLLALLLAGEAMASPIGVTGTGTFVTDTTPGGGNGWDVSFAGSDDLNSVQASCFGTFVGVCGPFGGEGLGANIDGQHFSPNFYSVLLGASGSITGYNSQFQPVVVQSLIAYIQITSQVCVQGIPGALAGGQTCTGTLSVTPFDPAAVPEPSTWLLTAAGLAILVASSAKFRNVSPLTENARRLFRRKRIRAWSRKWQAGIRRVGRTCRPS